MAITPTIRCPGCNHEINSHLGKTGCTLCSCHHDPNLIAVACIFGELTPAPETKRLETGGNLEWS